MTTAARTTIRIQTEDFDAGAEIAALHAGNPRVGAVCSFIGTVRGDAAGLSALELEHYPGMTERAIADMAAQAHARFGIEAALVIHRVGRLPLHAQIVMVAVAAPHRGAAFQACEFLIDYLKTQAPFWKKEHTPDGGRWVDARVADDAALARWGVDAPSMAM
ncbi:molybdenum cofactor biosynthesis protein MoaE [Xylophilus sp.]|uniref:molybdenum cofactor biosynthesis protein MoaE n=1 Tax=Xylophilus sp. TaxID=2653893 RepID=UPI0013BC5F6D|nr:molybdenum cofactor biosynthesis protein MoaE [Xylophilus sp.]KAF1045840.1 MAG: Molybdopterin synthase catalytic subunit [Xylophilus sp.]